MSAALATVEADDARAERYATRIAMLGHERPRAAADADRARLADVLDPRD